MQKHRAFKDSLYFSTQIVNIYFKYKFISKEQLLINVTIIYELKYKYVLTTTNLFGYDLPNNMNYITREK